MTQQNSFTAPFQPNESKLKQCELQNIISLVTSPNELSNESDKDSEMIESAYNVAFAIFCHLFKKKFPEASIPKNKKKDFIEAFKDPTMSYESIFEQLKLYIPSDDSH